MMLRGLVRRSEVEFLVDIGSSEHVDVELFFFFWRGRAEQQHGMKLLGVKTCITASQHSESPPCQVARIGQIWKNM